MFVIQKLSARLDCISVRYDKDWHSSNERGDILTKDLKVKHLKFKVTLFGLERWLSVLKALIVLPEDMGLIVSI